MLCVFIHVCDLFINKCWPTCFSCSLTCMWVKTFRWILHIILWRSAVSLDVLRIKSYNSCLFFLTHCSNGMLFVFCRPYNLVGWPCDPNWTMASSMLTGERRYMSFSFCIYPLDLPFIISFAFFPSQIVEWKNFFIICVKCYILLPVHFYSGIVCCGVLTSSLCYFTITCQLGNQSSLRLIAVELLLFPMFCLFFVFA